MSQKPTTPRTPKHNPKKPIIIRNSKRLPNSTQLQNHSHFLKYALKKRTHLKPRRIRISCRAVQLRGHIQLSVRIRVLREICRGIARLEPPARKDGHRAHHQEFFSRCDRIRKSGGLAAMSQPTASPAQGLSNGCERPRFQVP